jgi:hypothetical protein
MKGVHPFLMPLFLNPFLAPLPAPDINHDHLEPALDRFAQFFIAPTISGAC